MLRFHVPCRSRNQPTIFYPILQQNGLPINQTNTSAYGISDLSGISSAGGSSVQPLNSYRIPIEVYRKY